MKPAFSSLRRFLREPPGVERCDLCALALGAAHDHLVDPGARELKCACRACAILFSAPDGGRFKRVTPRAERLADLTIDEGAWERLAIPIGLAFFLRNGVTGRVTALYPSPAGATESLLALDAWGAIVAANPRLADLEADVEALLVHRLDGARGRAPEGFVVSVDRCYELVGLLRRHWRGLSGGPEAGAAIEAFFERLRRA